VNERERVAKAKTKERERPTHERTAPPEVNHAAGRTKVSRAERERSVPLTDRHGNRMAFEFRVGANVPAVLARAARDAARNGPIAKPELRRLQRVAREHGRIDDVQRMFLAGLLDVDNARALSRMPITAGTSVDFSLQSIHAGMPQMLKATRPPRPAPAAPRQRSAQREATAAGVPPAPAPPAPGRRAGGRPPTARARIQRHPAEPTYVPYRVPVTKPMTREEFQAAALVHIFGRVLPNVTWKQSKESYDAAGSPYTVQVDIRLVKRVRGEAYQAGGGGAGADGEIPGATKRAESFQAAPQSDEKSALMGEINRRYFQAVGDRSQITDPNSGQAQLWRMIRDEVLAQREYLANLPPQVKELIRFRTGGKPLTPADYDKLFAIAKKIEKLPPERVSDYSAKVTGTTPDLDAFGASLDRYIAEMAARDRESEKRDEVKTKLIGLEKVYEKYKLYLTLLNPGTAGPNNPEGLGLALGSLKAAEKVRKELESETQAHGFKGLDDFASYIKSFQAGFEQEAGNIAKDLLAKYAGKLYRESERYASQAEVAALHAKLGGLRARYGEFESNAKVWNDYARDSEQSRLPGQGHLQPKISREEAEAARKRAETAKAAAQAEVNGLAADHPIFQEESLPLDRRIDKAALAKASENELGPLLRAHISTRMKAVSEAREDLEAKPALIYKMDSLMPQFYVQQGIKTGSIHDKIIQDKMREDAILKLAAGITLGIVAVALAVVTMGAATPAIVAAGAGVAGAGLGAYMALEEYQEYVEKSHLADVGLGDDPSILWLVVAVVGAAVDMAIAAKAVKALGPAAKAVNAGGSLSEFTKAVRALEEASQLEASIARAAEQAAAARAGLAEASAELTKTMAGKMYGFPGPLVDPDVYKAVVKMARQAIKTKLIDAQKFIEELKLARIKAGLGDLAPEELAKAKQAWEEAKALEAAEKALHERLLLQIPDATKLQTMIAKAGDAATLERLLKAFPAPELETVLGQLKEGKHLALMLDHVGTESAVGMIRQWIAAGEGAKMNQFAERLANGVGKQLAEKAGLTGQSLMIDSNTAIALAKDADPALRATMQAGEKARVAYIKGLDPSTELRAANVTVGESSYAANLKGVPLEVERGSAEYQKVLATLSKEKVGQTKGIADRALLADALFAKTEGGAARRFLTSDGPMIKKLASMAGIDVVKAQGLPGLIAKYGTSGFTVTIEGRVLTVIPVP
jgi:hypothetical protein